MGDLTTHDLGIMLYTCGLLLVGASFVLTAWALKRSVDHRRYVPRHLDLLVNEDDAVAAERITSNRAKALDACLQLLPV